MSRGVSLHHPSCIGRGVFPCPLTASSRSGMECSGKRFALLAGSWENDLNSDFVQPGCWRRGRPILVTRRGQLGLSWFVLRQAYVCPFPIGLTCEQHDYEGASRNKRYIWPPDVRLNSVPFRNPLKEGSTWWAFLPQEMGRSWLNSWLPTINRGKDKN